MPRTIEGVPTSVAAFVGYTVEGPINEPAHLFSIGDFNSTFGAIDPSSNVSYAVAHFFLNGGEEAWLVRVIGEADAAHPSTTEHIGSVNDKTGIHALDKLDMFNLLAVPSQSAPALQAAMIAFAERRRAFAILDLPTDVGTLAEAKAWITENSASRNANAAAYYPRILASDPAQPGQARSFANSGAIAGIYARTDRQRGVWKAPAGTDAKIEGAVALEHVLTEVQQAKINPLGLNALRNFPIHGNVVWGSRTLAGADALASEWKYVPVRRTALFIEESLDRGLRWAQSEANGEPLWQEIRVCAGEFMHGLFRQNAFHGLTPREAYFVKCDVATTTQADIDSGFLNVQVGFAPIKPAEFVVVRIRIPTRG